MMRNKLLVLVIAFALLCPLLYCLTGNSDMPVVLSAHASSDFEISNGVLKKYNGTATSVTIPSSVVEIGSYAFKNNDYLTDVVIPSTVKTIGSEAFSSCDRLKNVTLSEGLLEIKSYAFAYCKALTTLKMPNSVTSVGSCAYYDCTNLATVTLSSNLSELGSSAFEKTGITSITIPGSLKEIPSSAFYNCDSLTKATITSGVQEIGNYVFKDCDYLTDVVIPSTVRTIGSEVFSSCDRLKNVTLSEGLQEIKSYAFAYCPKLVKITLPSTIDTMGSYVFYDDENTVVWVYRNSVAHTYSEANYEKQGFTYQIIDGEPTVETITLSASALEIDLHDSITFTAESNASSVTLYIMYNLTEGYTSSYTMTKSGSKFTYTHPDFANAGVKRIWAETETGLKSNELQVNVIAPAEKLATPSGNAVTTTAGTATTISWNAVTNATGYTAFVYQGNTELANVTSSISGTKVKYTFAAPGTYTVLVQATASGYDTSDAGLITVTVKEANDDVPEADDEATDITFASGSVSTNTTGGTVTVPFSINVPSDVVLGAIALEVDLPDGVTVSDVKTCGDASDASVLEGNTILITDVTTGISGSGKILEITFAVSGSVATPANVKITPTVVTLDTEETYTLPAITAMISGRTPGDVNDDGTVTISDFLRLGKKLAGWSGITINESNSDVNGDGQVTISDFLRLGKKLAGWSVELK